MSFLLVSLGPQFEATPGQYRHTRCVRKNKYQAAPGAGAGAPLGAGVHAEDAAKEGAQRGAVLGGGGVPGGGGFFRLGGGGGYPKNHGPVISWLPVAAQIHVLVGFQGSLSLLEIYMFLPRELEQVEVGDKGPNRTFWMWRFHSS